MKPDVANNFFSPSSFFGSLIPGSFLLVGTCLIVGFENIKPNLNFALAADFKFITSSVLILLSYTLGKFNSIISFKLRDLIDPIFEKQLSMKQFLDSRDLDGKITEFYSTHLGEDLMKMNYWKFHFLMREIFASSNKAGLRHAQSFTYNINFLISMLTPLIMYAILFFIKGGVYCWFGSILLSIVVLFYYGALESKKQEAWVIFINYYHYHTGKQKS